MPHLLISNSLESFRELLMRLYRVCHAHDLIQPQEFFVHRRVEREVEYGLKRHSHTVEYCTAPKATKSQFTYAITRIRSVEHFPDEITPCRKRIEE